MDKTKRVLSILLTVLIAIGIPLTVTAVDSNVYTVTLTQDSRVKYSGVQKDYFEIKENAYRSIYAKSGDDSYYVDSVSVNPEENADVSYNIKTGEVFIENVLSDITLTPVLKEKTNADSVDVKWELAGSGNYSEENPAAYVKFKAAVNDNEGNPVVNTKVSLKADESDKSVSTSSLTDKNGSAELKHSYGLGEHTAVITSGDISKKVTFKVVQQKKKELELYTYQVQASLKNTSTGSVSGINPLYEYYTFPLHKGALVVGSGEWKTPKNGEIKNLAPGQYGLRFKEYVEDDTIYLHSDFDYFTIDRAEWTVKADKDNSENVSFANDELYAAPGGDVFYYVAPEKGYEIKDYSVNKPSYISDISYNPELGYIKLSKVTGSVSLTVKAEKTNGTLSIKSGLNSLNSVALKSAVSALSVSSADGLQFTDVYQNTTGSEDGTKIYFTLKGDDNFTSSNLPTLYYKLSTASKYSTASTRNFTVNDDGTATGYFSVSATSSERVYDVYAAYGDEETDHVTLNLTKRPAITKTDLTVTNEKGDRANGTITVNKADYIDGQFIYNKQGSSNYLWSDTNVITGLEHGTWYVYVAPYFTKTDDNTYTVQTRSSSASVSVGQDDDEATYYTVKFVNAAGKTVSEKEYEEGTKASSVTVPANTADYTDGNKVYSYSWGEVSNVTSDKTYNEIETVSLKKTADISVTGVTQNNVDGNYLSFDIKLTDENGYEIENKDGVKVYIDGNVTRGNIDGNTFVGTAALSQGTHTVYASFSGDDYIEAKSSEITVNLTRAVKPELSQTPDTNASGKGTITITSPYSKFVYYRQGDSETVTEDKVITGLYGSNDSHVSALYYVYVPKQTIKGEADYNFLLPSDKATITVENIEAEETTEEETTEPQTEETTETPTEVTSEQPATEPVTEVTEPETEAPKKAANIEITDISQRETNNSDGNVLIVKVKVTDEDGNAVYEDISGYNVTLHHSANTSGRLNENGELQFTITTRNTGTTEFKAYFNGTDYESSESEIVTVNFIKPESPSVDTTPDINGKENGRLIISTDFDGVNYYKQSGSEIYTTDKVISGLSNGVYYVYIPAQKTNGESDYNFVLASAKTKATIEAVSAETFTVNTDADVELILPEYTENGDLQFNDIVKVHKNGAAAWKIGDTIVAYGDTYSFRVSGDVTVTPVNEIINEETTAAIVSTYKSTDTHQVRYQANFVVADGFEVVEHGFVYGKNINNDQLTLENVGQTGEYNGATASGVIKKYTFSEGYLSDQALFYYGITAQTDGDKASARAYIVVKDSSGNKTTVYSNVAAYIYA